MIWFFYKYPMYLWILARENKMQGIFLVFLSFSLGCLERVKVKNINFL